MYSFNLFITSKIYLFEIDCQTQIFLVKEFWRERNTDPILRP